MKISQKRIIPGKVLEFGCGNGRNAIYMYKQCCEIDAVDISQEAINWAKDNSKKNSSSINFICANVFQLEMPDNKYDFVYDCGLLHHLVPHRRYQYIESVYRTLKHNGHFGIVCFASGYEETSGVQEKSDMSVYKIYAMQGGMAYSIETLRDILSDFFEEIEIRAMLECNTNEGLFGKSFLWVSLWRKKCKELYCT